MRRLAVLILLLGLAACAAPARPSVVTLGDSVPAGTACGCTPFPALYSRSQHATDVNLAVPGSTSADVRAAVPAAALSASEVILMIGANDMAVVFDDPSRYATTAAAVESNVTATIEAIGSKARVIVLGYWNVMQDGDVGAATYGPDGVRNATRATGLINAALRKAAVTTGATYVSTEPPFHGPAGATALLAPDGDHPNEAGQAAIARLIPPLPL
ncbi:SGNH/GDSL hydrolase family protein [Paractinoplanes lichenicola]|uniref:SGNH/GDSL hydrolase family protein n=1 Tax=Paractinoplanes lichenicola TaxID=2802976 RepID=A0ABS1VNV7_9ACTN|nr:SGNH/GDSL hydrolase family protein [Actinoplanes lichenicola]MBL7256419.1 SGNH/GDSL hydrolase family protein [Actinoplanes lichenicola]